MTVAAGGMGCVCVGAAGGAIWVCGVAAAGATCVADGVKDCVADGVKDCVEPEASAWLLPPPQAVNKAPEHAMTAIRTTLFRLFNIAFQPDS
jgi:hypothetical protein